MRLVLALFALLVPPLALVAGRTRLAYTASALWIGAVLMFFALAWGPGMMLAGLSGLIATAATLAAPRRQS